MVKKGKHGVLTKYIFAKWMILIWSIAIFYMPNKYAYGEYDRLNDQGMTLVGWLDDSKLIITTCITPKFVNSIDCANFDAILCEYSMIGIYIIDYDVRDTAMWVAVTGQTIVTPTLPRKGIGPGFNLSDLSLRIADEDILGKEIFVNSRIHYWLDNEYNEYGTDILAPVLFGMHIEGAREANVYSMYACLGKESVLPKAEYKGRNVKFIPYDGEIDIWQCANRKELLPDIVSESGKYPILSRQHENVTKYYAPHELHMEYDVRYYNEVVERYPESILSYMIRAYAFKRSGNEEMALKDYCRIIEMSPNIALVHANRAELYYKHGMLQCAVRDMEIAARIDSSKYRNALDYYKAEAEKVK
ncbi:MAG: hypothetical protein EOM12_11150 [Verrucomicrobiae bacterium]|nr:hypothetical protein [Verrucomicrobiae bacterium]